MEDEEDMEDTEDEEDEEDSSSDQKSRSTASQPTQVRSNLNHRVLLGLNTMFLTPPHTHTHTAPPPGRIVPGSGLCEPPAVIFPSRLFEVESEPVAPLAGRATPPQASPTFTWRSSKPSSGHLSDRLLVTGPFPPVPAGPNQ